MNQQEISNLTEELGQVKYRINDVLNGEADTMNIHFEMGKIFQQIDNIHKRLIDELQL
jgi:ABC-type phosphate transport system ATPase subunit